MGKKLLWIAALFIGISIVLPWATMSGSVSYTTLFKSESVSSSGLIFAWGTTVRNTRTESGLWGNYPRTTEDTVSGSFPFQATVSVLWLIGLILVLAGLSNRHLAFIGGLISIGSIGYFLSELPNLNRAGSVASWLGWGSVNIKTEASIGCVTMILGSFIAIIAALYGTFETQDAEENAKNVTEEPLLRAHADKEEIEADIKRLQNEITSLELEKQSETKFCEELKARYIINQISKKEYTKREAPHRVAIDHINKQISEKTEEIKRLKERLIRCMKDF